MEVFILNAALYAGYAVPPVIVGFIATRFAKSHKWRVFFVFAALTVGAMIAGSKG
jgi:hypothetical protein